MSSSSWCATLTRVTASSPPRLTKRVVLQENDVVKNEAGGNLVRGYAEILKIANITNLATEITGLSHAQAMIYGIPRGGRGGAIASREAAAAGELTRTRDDFDWPKGSGFMLLDYDPPKDEEPKDAKTLWDSLVAAAPELRLSPAMIISSASGYIYHRETGRMLRGQRGLHVYIQVADARDIPRAGRALAQRLWLAGHGRYEVSKAGSFLERTLVDLSVWQPERLDFAAGALCVHPLEQRRPDPVLINSEAAPIDTIGALPDLCDPRIDELKSNARAAVSEEREGVRAAWVEARLAEKMANRPDLAKEKQDELRAQFRRAVEDGELFADFQLIAGGGEAVTVGQILDDPKRWHNTRFADPLEPDYGGDSRIAWTNLLSGGKPYIWSHAHGGQRYYLFRASRRIQVSAGELPSVIGKSQQILADAGQVYQRGGELVRVAGDGLLSVSGPWLRTHLESAIRFEAFNKKEKELRPIDCPGELHARIMHNRGAWPFLELRGLLRAPTLRPDGSLLDQPGHDPATGLLLLADGPEVWPKIPLNPNTEMVCAALSRLWEPVATFPYVAAVDRGSMLAAMLTACIRPTLPTAPAFLASAHTAGTGKTKLAQCLAALTGTSPSVAPWAREGEEQRKSIMAALLAGPSAMIIDNIVGMWESQELCAMLTAQKYEDRRLGASERVSVPTSVLMLATGNNVSVVGDLGRRVLPIRLDHGVERPDLLPFPFDPVERVRERWVTLRFDILTVLRGFIAAGSPRFSQAKLGSFEAWDGLIRQCVIWLKENNYAIYAGLPDIADPIEAVTSNFDVDLETTKLRAILTAWHAMFSDSPKSVSEVMNAARQSFKDEQIEGSLADALDEIAGEGGSVNSHRLGRWIERFAGRILDGLRFERVGMYNGKLRWSVKRTD